MDQHEVAKMLGVSAKTLEYWRWRKIGPKFIKIGRLARYRMSDVIIYINAMVREDENETSCNGQCSCHI